MVDHRVKIYINREPVVGPWGGGNKTLSGLVEELSKKADVVYNLDHKDIDVLFCFDPRPNSSGVWYKNLLEYREKFGAKIIQRVGDIGTHGKPDLTNLVYQSSHMSDFVIFPSDWSRKSISFKNKNYLVVPNSPLPDFFRFRKNSKPGDTLKIVTHHWSTNEMKGFDIYQDLGKIANDLKIEFTYIGRYPSETSCTGINIIGPKDKDELSKILPEHDVYLTASMYEAGANHVLEGIASGLPVIYRDTGGSIPEYICGYGLEYTGMQDLAICIQKIKSNYSLFKNRALSFESNFNDTIMQYVDIIVCES